MGAGQKNPEASLPPPPWDTRVLAAVAAVAAVAMCAAMRAAGPCACRRDGGIPRRCPAAAAALGTSPQALWLSGRCTSEMRTDDSPKRSLQEAAHRKG